jgi:hypothetical protein
MENKIIPMPVAKQGSSAIQSICFSPDPVDRPMTDIATIGHNNPPEPTPYELVKENVETVYLEASNWLDGATVEDERTAENISKLINLLRDSEKKAETARKEEKEPYLKAGKEIDSKYKALTDKVSRALDACKKALTPWLEKQEAIKREAAEKARKESEEKARAAQEAIRAASLDNLAEREKAEAMIQDAMKAESKAKHAEKDRARADSGGVGRAVSLRTVYIPVLVNETEAARYYWQKNKGPFIALLNEMAAQDVRYGNKEIPGFEIREEKRAV